MAGDSKAGWAVMGTGTIATEHMVGAVRSIGHEPLWVVSRNKRDAADFAQDLDIPQFTTNLPRVVHDPAVSYSYVSARLSRRPHYIFAAARAGKHILCDGPIAVTSKAARAVVEACRTADVTLAVNQPLRASTIHQTMKRMIDDGEIGRVQSVLIARGGHNGQPQHRRAQDPDRADKMFLNVSIDDIDLARFLTGAEPVEVSAMAADFDAQTGQLAYSIRFDNAALFQAQESCRAADVESLLLIVGERGAIMANGTLDGRSSGTLMRKIAGRKDLVPLREREPHVATVADFVAERGRTSSWLATGEDSLAAIRVIEALRLSIRARRSISM